MNERVKRILLLVAFLASCVGIGAALYIFFFRTTTPPAEPTVSDLLDGGALPEAGEGGERPVTTPTSPDLLPEADQVARGGVTQVTTLTTGEVVNSTLSNDGKSINYYDQTEGKFYTIDEFGNVTSLSEETFPNAQGVTWNKGSDKAVIEFPDGSNVIYDFASQTQTTLPKHWENFEFSPVRDEVAAKSLALDPNNRWLVVSSSDGSNTQAIQELGENANRVQVAWSPNDQIIGFADTSTGTSTSGSFDRKTIYPIGKNQENFKALTVEGLDFAPKWSPSGRSLVYSASSDYSDGKPILWSVDGNPGNIGGNRRSLGVNTWIDKCTFASDSIMYCAVPQNLPPSAGHNRRLYEGLPDTIYKVDITSGQSSLVAIPEEPTTIDTLTVSEDEGIIYFKNAATGRLEMIRLR